MPSRIVGVVGSKMSLQQVVVEGPIKDAEVHQVLECASGARMVGLVWALKRHSYCSELAA